MMWGSVPEWVAAVGTLGAFALALVLYRRQVEDRRADQASKIHVLTARNESYTIGDPGEPIIKNGHIKFVVSNTSNAPAYLVVVQLLPWEHTVHTKPLKQPYFESLRPNEQTAEYEVLSTEITPEIDDRRPRHGMRAPLAIEFTDAHGLRWKRLPDGSLWRRRRGKWKRHR